MSFFKRERGEELKGQFYSPLVLFGGERDRERRREIKRGKDEDHTNDAALLQPLPSPPFTGPQRGLIFFSVRMRERGRERGREREDEDGMRDEGTRIGFMGVMIN